MRIGTILAGSAFALVAAMASAKAGTINLGGYEGPIEIKFQNYEAFTGDGTISPGNQNFGVISVTSIEGGPGFNTTLWAAGAPGDGYISGVFDDILVTSTTGTPQAGTGSATGGNLSLFASNTNFDPTQGLGGYSIPSCAPNQLCYNGITNVGADNILNLVFASGIDPTNSSTTLVSTFDLTSTIPDSVAAGYLDIVSGTDTAQFQTGSFSTPFGNRDLFFLDNFCAASGSQLTACPANGTWPINSHDPVDASVVPEPASLGLLGAALISFCALSRRRKRKDQVA